MHELNEKCGVFGIYGKGMDVARITFFGVLAIQHRGQESAGMAVADGTRLECQKGNGLITQVFDDAKIDNLKGHIAIGQNRYSTSSGTGIRHAQPIMTEDGRIALAHNGNLPSVKVLEEFLKKEGVDTAARSDSYMMTLAVEHFIKQGCSLEEAVRSAYPLFTGSFSLLIMDKTTLVAARDPYGLKPFSMGQLNGGFAFSSETCSFPSVGATFMRDVLPGEMIVVDKKGMRSIQLVPPDQKLDIFEFVYFARSSSILLGTSVYAARKRCGIELARERKIDADMVIPIPETGIPGAVGYSEASGIPLELALVKNRYVYRTFIDPDDRMRKQGVKTKLAAIPDIVGGKRAIVIDDSIVRGNTSPQIVKILFEAGAKEVHFLVNSPPVRFPDFYGIDTPRQASLLAFQKTIPEIREFLGATSLHYLSYQGILRGIGVPEDKLCTSCFTGKYPLDIRERKAEVGIPALQETWA
ncbi:MAG: amidophosphoribosyltransferase [Minisyncoccia bacterium]|jgi:amidophosphoribosyltransferase